MAKLTITGTKAVINESTFLSNIEEHASRMKTNAIRKAPKLTGKLKQHGIKMRQEDKEIVVYLDLDTVEYGLYQELGWKYRAGRFFMESSFELECAKAEVDAKSLLKKAINVEGTNGYTIVEYRADSNGNVRKKAYKE